MAATLHDVVSANLVLVGIGLLNQPEEAERFRRALDLDLGLEVGLVTNLQSGLAEPSRTLTLDRERIALNLTSSRSTITREYPDRDRSDLARLAQVASLAIESTDLEDDTPRAYGYNIEMVFNQDTEQSAIQYLGERLFDYGLLSKEGRDLLGGRGQLIFRDAAGQWTISVGPRPGEEATPRFFLSLNLHKDEQRLPTEDEITGSLEEVWREALAFTDRLDKRGTS